MADRYTHRLERALATLEKADGRPVTYDDLEAAGVEQPAQTVYELEVAGEPIVPRRAADLSIRREGQIPTVAGPRGLQGSGHGGDDQTPRLSDRP
jgi:hypothetical protein